MMKALVWVPALLLVACQSDHLRRADSGTKGVDSGESCGDVQTDNNNCGRCGNACSAIEPSAAQCVMGRCLTTLFSQGKVPNIVVAGANVYWLNPVPATDGGSATALWRAGLEGGAPTILTTKCGRCDQTGQVGASSLHCTPLNADAADLYCVNYASITKMPLDGTDEPSSFTGGDWFEIDEIVLDASNIYWSTCYKDSYIRRAPLAGKREPTDVASVGPLCVANLVLHDSSLYWLGNDSSDYVDNTFLVKVSISDERAKPIRLLTWVKNWGRFVVGDAAIYWTDPIQGAVTALPLGGGNPVPIITGLDSPRDLAVDAGHLYWASYDSGKIVKLSLADGTLTDLATGQSRPHGIVVDATSVYWISTEGDRDTVVKVSPK